MDVVAVVETSFQHLCVCLVYGRLLGELAVQVAQCAFKRTVEEPAYKPKGEYVAAFQHRLVVKPAIFKGGLGH